MAFVRLKIMVSQKKSGGTIMFFLLIILKGQNFIPGFTQSALN